MSQILIAIGILVVLAILMDGVRRMRGARRDDLRVNISKRESVASNDTGYGSELPSGGARVVKVRDSQGFDADGGALSAIVPSDFVDTINLEQSVPMLMEVSELSNTRREPVIAPRAGDILRDQAAPLVGEPRVVSRTDNGHKDESPAAVTQKQSVKPAVKSAVKPATDAVPQQVLVINVMSKAPEQFAGKALLDVLLACGMRYGAMNIFHHHSSASDKVPMYSMANMVNPGTFDLNAMDVFSTPGVSFFMTLPSHTSAHQCFDAMLSTARAVASKLSGELRDDSRSVMTAQTIEYYRQRIRDFERKH